MRFSCTYCGNLLPDGWERHPSRVHFCSVTCAVSSGAPTEDVAGLKALLAADRAKRVPAPMKAPGVSEPPARSPMAPTKSARRR